MKRFTSPRQTNYFSSEIQIHCCEWLEVLSNDQCYDKGGMPLLKGLCLPWAGVSRARDTPPVPLRS